LAIRAQTHPLLPHPWLGRLLGSLVRARGVLGSLEVPPNIFIDSIIAYLYFYQKVVYASESPSLRVRVQVRTHTHTHTHTHPHIILKHGRERLSLAWEKNIHKEPRQMHRIKDFSN
jgi:hypothetical protein